MQTITKSSHKTSEIKATRNASHHLTKSDDAIGILTDDHAKVKKLFKEFEKLSKKDDTEAKVKVANQICVELTVHALAEEEIFYSATRRAIHAEELMNEADVEHDSAKDLIAQIQTISPKDPMYDAKVIVLGEYIDHHVKEEETEMFPKVRKTKLDLQELGMQLKMRKEQLKSKLVALNGDINVAMLKQSTIDAAAKKH
ncbi:MAG TPA: hemerythrin domain-containing protein [Methylotenera sp.]|nr:hemerythrin domain-containing protein [Methylotenera sp.]